LELFRNMIGYQHSFIQHHAAIADELLQVSFGDGG
jgi:hypothetical protein